MSVDASALAQSIISGDSRALARAITLVENGDAAAVELLRLLHGKTGRARRIGLTGPPGVGKSTLADKLLTLWLEAGKKVSLLAVDPSSPLSGGALLGDRIRIGAATDSARKNQAFVRSMASRGHLGGLALSAEAACDLMDAAGFDIILVETVGVGQSEIDAAIACDIALLALQPGAGDSIQSMKSGLLDVIDMIAINKCDLPGADQLKTDLQEMLMLRSSRSDIPILAVSAQRMEGLAELLSSLDALWKKLEGGGALAARRQSRLERRIRRLAENDLLQQMWGLEAVQNLLQKGVARGGESATVAKTIVDEFLKHIRKSSD